MNFAKKFAGLPVLTALDAITRSLAGQNDVVLSAPPGSGKTTGVPPLLLAEGWLAGRRIIMLEPRRLAARMAAARMAELLGEAVGETIGYRIRFDTRVSNRTRIEVVTEGILTRLLQNDPALEDYGLVIFDEFHERSVHADLALALCLDSKQNLREDLRLLIMSATLDVDGVAALLPGAEVINAAGRSFPVDIIYPDWRLPAAERAGRYNRRGCVEQMAVAIARVVSERAGSILAFLPGAGEINQLAGRLAAVIDKDIQILPLHGSLAKKLQDKAVLPTLPDRRKIVLATPIAETSLTIDGINTVIDSGWARYPKFDANSGLTRLQTRLISRASAEQRAGRAGRLAPGVGYRLWDKAAEYSMLSHTPPEILDTDLAQLVLELATWGVQDAAQLQWLDIPPQGHFEQARCLLTELGAFSQGRINETGKKLATLPMHPRLAAMLLRGQELGAAPAACDIAALLSERDIITDRRQTTVDLEKRLRILADFRAGDNREVLANGAALDACRRVDKSSRQWFGRLAPSPGKSADISAGNLLAFAYPDRIGKRRSGSQESYLLANGRGAKLPPADQLGGDDYLVIPHLDVGWAEGMIYLAAHISADDIIKYHRRLLTEDSEITWDSASAAVSSNITERLGALTVSRRKIKDPDPEKVKDAMLAGLREMGLAALPWDKASRDIQARVCCLRGWQPQENWPDLADEQLLASLAVWLGPYLAGITRRTHLDRLKLADILLGQCDWQLQQKLAKDAPTHITAPSGSRVRLQYDPAGEAPVMAVRLQEMFGLADTPAVCSAKIPVILHLLSPAGRPVQVTRDLRGFWDGTYKDVKKELQGRYPKHHWPADPWSAQPTARVKRRKGRGKNGKS